MTRASVAAADRKNAATASCLVTWTAASSTPAASRPTASRSAWSAAASASHPEPPAGGAAVFTQNFSREVLGGKCDQRTPYSPSRLVCQ